jgi:chorismate-pyruvate lyase
MDNTRWCFDADTVKKIHEAMRAEVPVEKLKEREMWRNKRLAKLAAHKQRVCHRAVVLSHKISSAAGTSRRRAERSCGPRCSSE